MLYKVTDKILILGTTKMNIYLLLILLHLNNYYIHNVKKSEFKENCFQCSEGTSYQFEKYSLRSEL